MGDSKATFSITTAERCWGLLYFTLDMNLKCWVLSKEVSNTIFFCFFSMIWPGIEPVSPRPFVNTFLLDQWASIWHNSYCIKKTWWSKFKYWTRLFWYHLVQMPFRKQWVHFFLTFSSMSKFVFIITTSLGVRNLCFKTSCTFLKNWTCVTSCL